LSLFTCKYFHSCPSISNRSYFLMCPTARRSQSHYLLYKAKNCFAVWFLNYLSNLIFKTDFGFAKLQDLYVFRVSNPKMIFCPIWLFIIRRFGWFSHSSPYECLLDIPQ
jgi:hypothetical protein